MGNRPFSPLVVAVFGLSTPAAYEVFLLVYRIVEAITGPTLRLHIGSLQELSDGFAQRNGGSVVVTADLPSAELTRFVCASQLPIIAVADDLDDTLAWTQSSRKVAAVDAVRLCTQMLATLAPAFASPHALIVDVGRDQPPEAIAKAITEYLYPNHGEWLAAETFRHVVNSGLAAGAAMVDWRQYREHAGAVADQDRQLAAAARLAVESYGALLSGGSPAEIVWPLELFRRLDDRPPYAPVELTGPARTLLFGPYLYLPIGGWIARVEFEINGAHSGVEAMADVRVGAFVTERRFDMPAKGIFAYDLHFQVDDPHHDVEIRLFLKKSAIEGVFLPRSVRVRRQPRAGD